MTKSDSKLSLKSWLDSGRRSERTAQTTLLLSLDSISEKKIQDAINPIIDSRTSILIAHRLSTILAADEILVIKDGVIAERGVHADLVKAGGTYAELYETQFYRPDEE